MSETMLRGALQYESRGFSVIPLSGKVCKISWEKYQETRATSLEIGRWWKEGRFGNIGVICGAVSGNVVVMDCDGLEACYLFEKAFPALAQTYTVATGSGVGRHYYFRVKDVPPTTRVLNLPVGNLELRADGCYVVAPPSVHPDTEKVYKAARRVPMLNLSNLEPVKEWLYRLLQEKQRRTADGAARKQIENAPIQLYTRGKAAPAGERIMKDYGAAARAALNYEVRDVAASQEGGRNVRLSKAAYNLGQLVGDGLLTRAEVESALLGAARACGLGDGEAARTIESGINEGMSEPRSLQWKKRA